MIGSDYSELSQQPPSSLLVWYHLHNLQSNHPEASTQSSTSWEADYTHVYKKSIGTGSCSQQRSAPVTIEVKLR